MKKSKGNQMNRKSALNKGLLFVIIMLIAAPVLINGGLAVTDVLCDKLGITLTAKGLGNESWLDFWKYYLSTAIAFFGVYLVWDTANKDRKSRDNKGDSIQYLSHVSLEEKTLVEVVQCFNTGVIYKALNQLGETTVQECKAVLQVARDKTDEAHIKFEMLTDIVDDYERCSRCEHNPCWDRKIKEKVSGTFYDMEKRYTDLLNVGDDYLNKVATEKRNLEIMGIQTRIRDNLKDQISYLQQRGGSYEELAQKQEELSNVEKQIAELNKAKMSREEMERLLQSAEKEIDCLAKERAAFIGYCKSYINLQKGHARDLKNNGVVTYMKAEENSIQDDV